LQLKLLYHFEYNVVGFLINEVEVVWKGKIKKVSLVEQVPADGEEIVAVSRYWLTNALGMKVFIKATSRDLAQLACDEYYGKNFYKVNSNGDKPKGDVTVRASGTRRGQQQANQKSRILNS